MRAKNFVVNRGVSCFIRGVSCFIRGVPCFIRGVSCFIRCILSCFIRCNPVFQSWSSRRERVKGVKCYISLLNFLFSLFVTGQILKQLILVVVVYGLMRSF